MLPALDRLVRLQAVETRAGEARKRIADAPGEIAALDAKLTASQDAVAAAKQEVSTCQGARRTFDKDLIAAQQRLSKYKEQLMEVKTNAEYHAMQHQIQSATTEVGKFEELILINMIEADDIAGRLKSAEAKLKADEAALAKDRAGIQADAAGQERVLVESERERGAIVAEMSASDLELFERVLKARQGIAVAPAIDGHCSICHVRLRPQVYNTILKNEAIVQCDHCQRVLYFAGVHQRSAAGQAAVDAAHLRQNEHERPTP
jgi:predicted  nucleic acid-binding Zn-ribbon protein